MASAWVVRLKPFLHCTLLARLNRLRKKSEPQIPHRLKPVRDDKNKGLRRGAEAPHYPNDGSNRVFSRALPPFLTHVSSAVIGTARSSFNKRSQTRGGRVCVRTSAVPTGLERTSHFTQDSPTATSWARLFRAYGARFPRFALLRSNANLVLTQALRTALSPLSVYKSNSSFRPSWARRTFSGSAAFVSSCGRSCEICVK
jgi:hypothetical protein